MLHMSDVPPRSRLYGLVQREVGTVWIESLTSYLNRLAWKHGVSPRSLIVQEIVPHLSGETFRRSPTSLGGFGRAGAMGLNGLGNSPVEWSTLLQKLTGRTDLHLLTLRWWISGLRSHRLLRESPVWCSACYAEWREKDLPIYQPLGGKGAYTTLTRLTGCDRSLLYDWVDGTCTPSLENLLSFCYVCHVTPLQVMTNQLAQLKQVIRSGISSRSPRSRRLLRQVDRERCLELIQAILDGREELLGVRQMAMRLGHEPIAIKHHFPKECALIRERAREQRRQRKEQRLTQACEEIRTAVISLHLQGISPSFEKVKAQLTQPGFMRMSEARNT
jgi:TniQ